MAPKKRVNLQAITFNNPDIFGKGFTRIAKSDIHVILKMMADGALNFDGTIDIKSLDQLDKKQLWLYLRYLWVHNHNDVRFSGDFKQDAEATDFVDQVLGIQNASLEQATSITANTLATYINSLVERHKTYVNIPALKSLVQLVLQKIGQDTSQVINTLNTKRNNTSTSMPVKVNIFSQVDDNGAPIIDETSIQQAPLKFDPNGQLTVSIKV